MNKKRRKTLTAIFTDPVSGTIEWSSVETLLVGIGCETIEGDGSRVKFAYKGNLLSVHRPHDAKEAKRYQIKDVRDFLILIGVKP